MSGGGMRTTLGLATSPERMADLMAGIATAPGYYAVIYEDPDRIKLEVVAPSEG